MAAVFGELVGVLADEIGNLGVAGLDAQTARALGQDFAARQMGDVGSLPPGRRIGDVALRVPVKAIVNEMKGA